jgi:hypothetical protein
MARLSAVPGVRDVRDAALHVVGEPYCRVLSFLSHPALTRSDEQKYDVAAIGASTQAGVVRFTAGMALELELGAPNFESRIYVDYFTADGRVYHLFPGDRLSDNTFAPNERFGIGGRYARGRKATIGPPYGLDVAVALASSRPLLERARPAAESAADYLEALGAAISEARLRDPALRVEYAYYLVRTSDRTGP